jgi:hypothetical protein
VDLFSLSDIVPKTCTELLQTSDGGTITLTAEVDEVRRNSGDFNIISVKVKGLPKKSQLRTLENEWMNPYELELLVECEGLVDASIGKEFTLDIDVSQLRGIRLPSGLSEDSQLVQFLRSDDEEHEEKVLSLPKGEWMLSSYIKRGMIQWTLESPQTKPSWMGEPFATSLNGTLNLEEMIEELLGELKTIGASRNNIFNYDEELVNIKDALRTYGWGDEKPLCRAEAKRTGGTLRIILRTCGENEAKVFDEEFIPSEDDNEESVIEMLDEWALSNYTIENKKEFRRMMSAILDDEDLETGGMDSEESELLMIIEGYREEGKFSSMCAHTNHLVEYYIQSERIDDALQRVKENISLLVSMDREDEDSKWYLFVARVMMAEIFVSMNNTEGSIKEIEKAFNVIPDDIQLWQLGVGTKREYYERGLKLRDTL